MSDSEDPLPWRMVNDVYRDITIVAEGMRLEYHKAVLVQHSRLLRQLITEKSWCGCQDVVISLDDVTASSVRNVMDLIYSGVGGVAGDRSKDFTQVIDMLQIDTIVVSDVEMEETSTFGGFHDLVNKRRSSMSNEAPVSVPPEDLLVTRSMSAKAKAKTVERSRTVSMDTMELLRNLQEEKNKVTPEEAGRQKRGRKKKMGEMDGRVRPEVSAVAKELTNANKSPDLPSKSNFVKENVNINKFKPSSPAPPVKIVKSNPRVSDAEIVIDDDIKKEVVRNDENDKYVCPYHDCQSESKSAQSIKIHLALVHYKKTIQAEFPNWKKQKCDECDRSIGQMTAYYLHMANHKKYKYMDLTPDQLRASKSQNVKENSSSMSSSSSQPFFFDMKPVSNSQTNMSPAFVSANKVFTPKPKSYSPMTSGGVTRSNSFVKGVVPNSPKRSSIVGGFSQGRSSSFIASSSQGFQSVRTPLSKFAPKAYGSIVTPGSRGPPGPIVRLPGPTGERSDNGIRRESFGGIGSMTGMSEMAVTRRSRMSLGDGDAAKISLISKDNKKQRGF